MTDSAFDPTTESKVIISDDDLVAYLDGELVGKPREALEERLIDDSPLRHRLRQLQTSWEMLDHLPDPPPSRDLVESTMEMAVVDVTRSLPAFDSDSGNASPGLAKSFFASRGHWYLFAFLLCGCLGAGIAYVQVRAAKAAEVDQIRVAADLDALIHAKDLDFMRWLAQSEGWNQWMRVSQQDFATVTQSKPSTTLLWSDQPLDRALSVLSATDRAQIQSSVSRLKQMTPEAATEIGLVAKQLAAQTDREELIATMRNYAKFREGLNAERRDAIESSATALEKQAALEEALAASIEAQTRRSGDSLDDESVDAIYDSLLEILEQRLKDGDPVVREMKRTMKRLTRRDDSDLPMLWRLFGDRGPAQRRDGAPSLLSKISSRSSITDRELDQVFQQLPLAASERLQTMAGQNELLGKQILVYWVEEAIRRKAIRQFPGGRLDAKQRYAELPDDVRDEIDLLPPDEFFRILTTDRNSRGTN